MRRGPVTPARLDALVEQARRTPRRRAHLNLHDDADEPCQRLFIALEPDSYIAPHNHAGHATRECLLAVRGTFALVLFDSDGEPRDAFRFGGREADLAAVELAPETWHTVLALTPGAVLFETKSGPYRADAAKVRAAWAPAEGEASAPDYLSGISRWARARLGIQDGASG
jgi:hypothetical protein